MSSLSGFSGLSAATVIVPATTANLGPGFDCLGAALTMYNQFQFTRQPSDSEAVLITVTGLDADRVNTDARNLAYQSFTTLYQQIGQTPPPIHLSITLDIPLSRGLGSSATAIVAGLVGANCLAGSPLSTEAVMDLAIALEGHPDNVVPALMGGCRLSASHADGAWVMSDIPWHRSVVPIVAIPKFELSTAVARSVLPDHYSRADAIFNAAHLGLLLRGLDQGRADWLTAALVDRIHQPYRQSLIPGYEAMRTAALEAGAYGLVISGAGPTLLALAHIDRAAAVEAALATVWPDALVHSLQLDNRGVVVQGVRDIN